jgi:SSS family solute:Na+ symporter
LVQVDLLFFIALYLVATILLGYWASRKVKTTADFVVAGRNLPMVVAAFALFATWFGSETVLGASSEFIEHGLIGVIEDPFGAALCLFLAGKFLARPLYKLNLLTFGDYYRMRFGRRAELIASILMIPSYFGWIAAQLVALGIILESISGLPISIGIVVCAVVVTIYTYIGGMWAVSITDFVQTIMIVAGMLAIAVVAVQDAGGLSVVLQKASAENPDFFNFLPKEKSWTSWLTYFTAWITLGLGSLPQQDIFQRVMAAKSEKDSINAAYFSSVMYLTVAFIPLVIALCAKQLYPDLAQGNLQMLLPTMVVRHFGHTMKILFFGALLSAILSTTSGAILAPATVLGENIIKPYFKQLTDSQLLFIIRLSILFIAGISCIMSTLNSNIYELVSQSSALSLVGLFTPLIVGLYWKRANANGAVASMLVGTGSWLIFVNLQTSFPPTLAGWLLSLVFMYIFSVTSWPKKRLLLQK